MTQSLTVEEATKALDEAIARHQAATKAAADMYGDVVAARAALDAAFLAEDDGLQQCVVSVAGTRTYKMVVIDRRDDQITCRYLGGSNRAQVMFKWHVGDGSYVAMIGQSFDRRRRIVALCCEPLSGSDDRGRAATQ